MILFLLTDEKFTDYAIQQFSALGIESEFVLIPSNNMMSHVKLINQCTIINQWSPEFDDFLNRLDQYTGIFFHGLYWGSWQKRVLERIPDNVKIAWYFWGGEIYSRHELETAFLAPLTMALYKTRKLFKRNKSDTHWELPLPLFNKVDYCLTSMQEEYEYAKQFTGAKFKHLWYTCYSLEETVGALMDKQCAGNNVWIGNAATIKNNHLDTLWAIRRSGALRYMKDGQFIVPLSYGELWVKNLFAKWGQRLLGERMRALIEFMPREEYNALMLSCSTMIINYLEPAAQGNIITGLWLGMRVYLSEKSLAYAYYKRIGANVYSLESDLKKYQFAPLSEEERAENRRVLNQWYSKQHVMEAVQNVVHALQ